MNGTCSILKISKLDSRNGEDWLRRLITQVIDYFKNESSLDVRPGDGIGMSFKNSTVGGEKDPVYISMRRADQISADVVLIA